MFWRYVPESPVLTDFSLTLPAGTAAVDVLVARAAGGDELDPSLVARLSIVRIR